MGKWAKCLARRDNFLSVFSFFFFFLLKVCIRSQKKEHCFHVAGAEPLQFTNDISPTHEFS